MMRFCVAHHKRNDRGPAWPVAQVDDPFAPRQSSRSANGCKPSPSKPGPSKPRPSRDPYKIRRTVRLVGISADGIAEFVTYSMTRAGQEIQHHPHIDTETGAYWCDCEDHQFRKGRLHGNVYNHADRLERMCKHVLRAIGTLERRGLLRNANPHRGCIQCGVAGAEYEVVDAHGEVVPNLFICSECITAAPAAAIQPQGIQSRALQ